MPLSLTVPGRMVAESLTFAPLEDMIFLKWEEPQEPNGLITQYEVSLDPVIVGVPGGRWAHSLEREAYGGDRDDRCGFFNCDQLCALWVMGTGTLKAGEAKVLGGWANSHPQFH